MGLIRTPDGVMDREHVVNVGVLPAGIHGQQSLAKDESLSRLSVHNTVSMQICTKVHQRFFHDGRRHQTVPFRGGYFVSTIYFRPSKLRVGNSTFLDLRICWIQGPVFVFNEHFLFSDFRG